MEKVDSAESHNTNLIKNTFDTEANSLVNYAHKLAEIASDDDNPRYVVLMCRRWLIIYEIIRHACFSSIDEQRILCDDDLFPLEKKGDCCVLVSDDIIIHGRTAMKMYNYLTKNGHKTNVSAFFRKYNAEKLNLEVFNSLSGRPVTEFEWKDLSNRMIEFIIKSKIPYTTFTYSFVTRENKFLDFSLHDFKQETAYQEKILKECNVNMTVHFAVSFDGYKLLSKICSHVCIREYKYGDGSTIYIPFVVIPQIRKDIFNELSKCDDLPASVKEVFNSKVCSDYKARLLSFLLGYIYGKVTFKNSDNINNLDENKMIVIDSIISKSFTSTFHDIMALSMDESYKILTYSIENNSLEDSSNNEIDEHFFAFGNDHEKLNLSPRDLINDALSKLHNKNEELAKDKNSISLWGYRLSEIFDNFEMDERYNCLANLISLWDIGRGGYCFKECGDYVYATVSDGEQVYRIQDQKFNSYARSYFLLRKHDPFYSSKEYIDFIQKDSQGDGFPDNFSSEFSEAEIYFNDKLSSDLEIMKSLETPEWEERLYNKTLAFLSKKKRK